MRALQGLFAHGRPRVGVVGLGYIGLPLALTFVEAGIDVLGFDVDPAKPRALARGESYLSILASERVARAVRGEGPGRLEATDDFERLRECDAVSLCVPTPLGEDREPDLSYVRSTAEVVAKASGGPRLVVLESTTYPGTTEEEVLGALERAGAQLGHDVLVAYSPERLDPGNERFEMACIPKLVGGLDEASGDAAEALYARAFDTVVRVSHARVAEAAKLFENVYRAVNIALVNELREVFRGLGIDVWEVLEAARTKPFGLQVFEPGPGLGGHCLPIDPYYLAWKAKRAGVPSRFIELAGELSLRLPPLIVERITEELRREGRELRGAKVLVLGVAYKSGVSDTRESPGLALLGELRAAGADVAYHDPKVPRLPRTRRSRLELTSVEPTPELLAEQDVVLMVTPQPEMDLAAIARHARRIVDTRNAFGDFPEARVVRI